MAKKTISNTFTVNTVIDGDDAAIAFATPAQISIPCYSNGNVKAQKITSVTFSLKVGTNTATVTSCAVGTKPTGVTVQGLANNAVTITVGTSATASGLSAGVTFTVNGSYGGKTYSANVTVALIGAAQGGVGERGKVGRFFYFGGVFDSSDNTTSFVVNDAQAPYFEHTVDGQKRYHVFNYETNGSYTMSQMWAISSNWNNKPWEVMTNDFKYIITEALFSAYAHLGSFIINEDWMLSQYGELVQPSGNIITVNASNVNTKYSGNAPVVLNGNHVNNGIIVYKVSFNVSSATTINITLTTSSENNYDFGAVGKVDNDSLLSATASSIKSDTGSVTLLKISGSSTVSTSISLNAGSHYLYIGYFKDGSSNVGNDNASFDISGATYNLTEAKKTSGMSMSGGPRSVVPYCWFDNTDPEVKTLPTSGYKFRPAFAVDGLTGKSYQNEAYIKGQIVATSGSIDSISATNLNIKSSTITGDVTIGGDGVNIKLRPTGSGSGVGASIVAYDGTQTPFSLLFDRYMYSGNYFPHATLKLESFAPYSSKCGKIEIKDTESKRTLYYGSSKIPDYTYTLYEGFESITNFTGFVSKLSLNNAFHLRIGITQSGVACIIADAMPTVNDVSNIPPGCFYRDGNTIKIKT